MKHRKGEGNGWEPLYEMARIIANSKASGRHYREDIVSEAYLAVANGADSRSDIENAIRQSLRDEWKQEDRHATLEVADSLMRNGAPERARPDLWGALASLTERQRAVVVMTFWEGMTSEEISEEMGIPRRTVSHILERAVLALKIFFFKLAKNTAQSAVGK
jgi:RNA polymerase sigma factor (sigma-70 family)